MSADSGAIKPTIAEERQSPSALDISFLRHLVLFGARVWRPKRTLRRIYARARHAIDIKSNSDLISLYLFMICVTGLLSFSSPPHSAVSMLVEIVTGHWLDYRHDPRIMFDTMCRELAPLMISSKRENAFRRREIATCRAHVTPTDQKQFTWSILFRFDIRSLLDSMLARAEWMQKRRVIFQIHLKEFQKCQDTCQNLQDARLSSTSSSSSTPFELVKCISDRRLWCEQTCKWRV